jgi:hypothetical protein
MENKAEKKLKADVAEKYQVLKGHGVGEYHFKGQAIHLDRIDVARADELVGKGFVYLVPVDEKKETAKTVAIKTEEKKPNS